MPRERQAWAQQYLSLADVFDGEDEIVWTEDDFIPDTLVIEACNATVLEKPLGEMLTRVTEVIVSGRASEADTGATERYRYAFGVIAIMEGIAYELDQIVAAGTKGTKNPEHSAPLFPYHLLREVARWKCLGIQMDATLHLASLSLLSNDPAGALLDIFDRYNILCGNGLSPAGAIERIYDEAADIRRLIDAVLSTDIPELEKTFANAGALGRGVGQILQRYRELLRLRQRNHSWNYLWSDQMTKSISVSCARCWHASRSAKCCRRRGRRRRDRSGSVALIRVK